MKGEHILFGVSPFNSKFNAEYLVKMLDWGFDNYTCVDVLHPHEEARFLLMGCGDVESKTRRKSRKEFSRTDKIVINYLVRTGNRLSSGRVLRFSDFYHSPIYQSALENGECSIAGIRRFGGDSTGINQ